MDIRIYKIRSILLSVFFLLALSLCATSYAIENNECLSCHGDTINAEAYNLSIHGKNLCTGCHIDLASLPHQEKPKPPTCNQCHRIEYEIYSSSDHGIALKAGISEAASCKDCHGDSHQLLNSRDPKSQVYRLNIPKTCASCHEDEEKMAKYALVEKMPFKSYAETVHGKAIIEEGLVSSATCADCHGSHDLHSLNNPKSKIYRINVPSTCGKCHENVFRTYQKSIHGKDALSGKREAPVCTDCHGEHTIKSPKEPTSSVYPTAISEKTCAHCHAAEKITTKYRLPDDRVKTYLESYHGLASKYGSTTVANCASCHGAHDILPSSDPRSSVNKKNLPKTCGKCHPGVGEQLAKGSVHVAPTTTKDRAVFYVTIFYIILIILTIGGMLIHNLLDFLTNLKEHYRLKKEEAKYMRFTLNERLQHFLLFITFTALAYTGFALKYPEAWWAMPFTVLGKGYDWRGVVHRIAAIIFCALCAYHIIFLITTKKGREEFRAFLPRKKDLKDLFDMLKHNLGLKKERPKFERFNYIEKSEYWALVWGSVIMVVTGLMLMFENFTMKYFPKWMLDVANTIHFYEAILATLAIIVWHFYFSIFDPLHYPMNWDWITGRTSEERQTDDQKPQSS